jgi:glycosyltransferase involved in cell wall biosynthesis
MCKKEKIRVLHLLLSLEIGGMERFVYEHCFGIDKSRFDVFVCCIDRLGGFYDRLVEHGIQIDLLQKNQKKFDWFFPLKLSKYLRNNKIDILHIHTGAFFYGSVAGYLARTKGVIYTEHGRHYKEPWQLYILDQISARCINQIVTVSDALEDHLINKIRLPSKKIQTIINGVNTETFVPRQKPDYLLKEFSFDRECKIIGTVGRLAVIKDQKTLIKAFRLVKDQHNNSKLLIVGEGECERELEKLVDDLKLKNDVVFTGNRSDVPSMLNFFDVFVLPSLMEGTSISLLEAMASGVPCVVTNVGGNVRLISNGISGFTVPPGNVLIVANKILELFQNISMARLFSIESRRIAKDNYSFDRNIERYRELYNELYHQN